ncbi:hypothetical protein P22_0518 [Propionispora sp. 2/2-37]|uniref:hypothetical protein n=1 Tax=Propionispora sp. 2/2-37 TaxID=1677858 RepID=UPI0006BB9869|nr:hypothetical protein [Propionispora sp. 2/2-37]CUH94452.1 hypothetical protein P22_0518 [Propionispora sp. 2/2-37]
MLNIPSEAESITAIFPKYTATGDHTVIYLCSGKQLTGKTRVATVIRKLANARAIDLYTLKKQTAAITQRSILQPLPLTPSLILVPVKIRIPRLPGDSSTGYFNYRAVTGVSPGPEDGPPDCKAVIHLTGGLTLPCVWTVRTIKKYMQYACLTACRTPGPLRQTLCETSPGYVPDLEPILQKLLEVLGDILHFRRLQG